MSIVDIRQLPVKHIAANDSMLWLWTTNSHIREAFTVLDTWNFEYKTMATWVKNRFGLGYWLRGKTEHLLLGVRGNPRTRLLGPHGATGMNWSTLIEGSDTALILAGQVTVHSKKPQSAYEMIEAISEPPRVELFARSARKGWETWGLEAVRLESGTEKFW